MTLKICSSCKLQLSIDKFSPRNRICRSCRNNLHRIRRALNPEKIREENRKQYYKHKERVRKTQKKYEIKIAKLQKEDIYYHSKYLLKTAKLRAKRLNIDFNISCEDIFIPERCPIFGIEIKKNDFLQDTSATIDRINPKLGYIKNNVIVISWRANRIKSNATLEELLKIANFYKELTDDVRGYSSKT